MTVVQGVPPAEPRPWIPAFAGMTVVQGSRLRSPAPGFPPSRERRLCEGPACGAPPLGSRLRGNDGCARGPACGAPPLDSGLRRNDGCARVPPAEPRPWVPAFAGTTVMRGSRLRSPAPGFRPSRERRLCEGPACGAPPLDSGLRGNDGYARVPPAEPRPWVPAFAGTTVMRGSRLRSPAPGFRPSRERRLCEGPACGAPPLGSGLRGNDGYARVPPAEPRPWVPAFAGTTVMRGSRLRSPAPGFRPSRERRLCEGPACGAPPLGSGLRGNDGCARGLPAEPRPWIPAFAGMTVVQGSAFAGMTEVGDLGSTPSVVW